MRDSSSFDPVAAIEAVVESIFDPLQQVRAEIEDMAATASARRHRLKSSDLDGLEELCVRLLRSAPMMVQGLGFSSAVDVIADSPYSIRFWIRTPEGVVDGATYVLDPERDDFYEYVDLEWFAALQEGAARFVSGPYVDYGGSNEYTLTFSVAARTTNGRLLGAVTADVSAPTLERALLDTMAELDGTFAVIDTDSRVIVSNDPEHSAGSLLTHPSGWKRERLAPVPWRLARRPS